MINIGDIENIMMSMMITLCVKYTHYHTIMTQTQHQQITQDIYRVLQARLAASSLSSCPDHSQRLAYELGVVIGLLADLAERDSYVYEELQARLRKMIDKRDQD